MTASPQNNDNNRNNHLKLPNPHNTNINYLLLITCISSIGSTIILPLVPFYAEHFGATPLTITALYSVYAACIFISSPLWGRLSDKIGRVPIIFITLLGTIGGYLCFYNAKTVMTIFIARMLMGCMAGNIGVVYAYIAGGVQKEEYAATMGKVTACGNIGNVGGLLIGGLLAGYSTVLSISHYKIAFIIAMGITVAGALIALLLREPSNKNISVEQTTHQPTVLHSSVCSAMRQLLSMKLITMIGIFFIGTFALAQVTAIFPIWAQYKFHWGGAQVSHVLIFYTIIGIVTQGKLVALLTKKFTEKNLILCSLFLMGIGLIIMPVYNSAVIFLAGCSIFAIGVYMQMPLIFSYVSRNTADKLRGTMLGSLDSIRALSMTIAPLLGGYLYQSIGKDSVFYFNGILTITLCLLFCVIVKKHSELLNSNSDEPYEITIEHQNPIQ